MFSGKPKISGFGKTIGARLTWWGTLTMLTVCTLVCALVYVAVYISLHREVDRFLIGEVHEFMAIVDDESWNLAEAQEEIRFQLGSRAEADLSFRILDQDKNVLLSSHETDPLRVSSDVEISQVSPVDSIFITTPKNRSGHSLRVCSVGYQRPDGRTYIAQAGYVLDLIGASLAKLRMLCIFAILVGAVLSIIGGRILARRILAPVQAMTLAAQQIGAQRLSERLPRSGNGDELDQLSETLNQLMERIEKHVQQMQQFTADASHELRTPLAALRGNAEVALTRNRSAEELRKVLEDSIEHYDRLTKIADDLLLLARADAGCLPLNRQPMRLEQAVADVVDLYKPLASEHGIELTSTTPVETWVNADGSLIRQLICNLVDNGIKYAGSGKKIQVFTSSENGTAKLTVTDDGPGVSPEHLAHIFDRFYRADRARTGRSQGGAGLGLSICRTIAEAHDGNLMITSESGCGTTVVLMLPK
ncbi:MAG: Adaptive-response sensory-kinase SasA [Phycisphaerae bacterium]|nr:Adaptive-response sensory-kinase SasA [Phycisphaerae bacterium]